MQDKPGTAETTRLVNTAAANLTACAEGVRESIQAILRSFDTPGSLGAERRERLDCKVREFENLADLCDQQAERLANAGMKVCRDHDQEGALAELTAVGQFIADQLQSERGNARSLLSDLRNMTCGCGKGGAA